MMCVVPLLLVQTACATSCTSQRDRERDHPRYRLCHLCLLHLQTQQTIVSGRETRVHDRGVWRAATGCPGCCCGSLLVV